MLMRYLCSHFAAEGMIMKLSAVLSGILILSCCLPAAAQQEGAALYAQHCAQCHDATNALIRAPSRSAIQAMSFEHVLGTLTAGSMASIVRDRTRDERRAIASFVTDNTAQNVAPAATADAGPGTALEAEVGVRILRCV